MVFSLVSMSTTQAIEFKVNGESRRVEVFPIARLLDVLRAEGKVSGAWVFKGTRVPVKALFENLETGATIDQFLAWFPGVTRDQALAVLTHAEQSLAQV